MHPIWLLLAFTLITVTGIAVWQYRSVQQSQRERGETKSDGHPFGPGS